jgi:hypothetical protein
MFEFMQLVMGINQQLISTASQSSPALIQIRLKSVLINQRGVR